MENNILFSKALCLAAQKHQTQTRRDGSPYIWHPIKVAEIVRESGFDLNYQMVALLHDTLEDTDATEEDLLVFGRDVCEAVKLLTRPKGMDEKEYLAKILENHMATVVKAADKMHNMWECSRCDDARWAARYIEKSRKYYYRKFNRAVDDAISAAGYAASNPMVPKKAFSFRREDMKLYSEIQKERYLKAKAKYNPDLRPARTGSEIYYREEMGGYLVIEEDRFFVLQPYGWVELTENPIYSAVDPLEEYRVSMKTAFEAFIACEAEKREYFYDFVEIGKL